MSAYCFDRRLAALTLAVVFCASPRLMAQVNPDQAAAMLLNGARKAYNEKNYPFAITRFREYLAKYGNQKDAPSARYGLALALLEGPGRDFTAANAELQQLAGNQAMAERPYVLYYLAHCQRGLGSGFLATALAKPQEAANWRNQANQRFEEAAKHFAAATAAFTAHVQADPKATTVPEEREWAARAQCDLAEMQIRTLKIKEARATAAPFENDPLFKHNRYRPLGLYYFGLASYLLKDHQAAGRALNQLTPFDDPVFGTHARYLLARTYHAGDERPEAASHYQGVLDDYAKHKLAAVESLKRPDLLKDPDVKVRLEALAKGPPPDYVARATFFLGVMRYEEGKFDDALARLVEFGKLNPSLPLQAEAELRRGFCHVQLKQYKEALAILQPVVGKEPRLADQALLWTAKAQVGAGDPNNAAAYAQALNTAIQTFRTAADRAGQMAASDPEAKVRRGEILLELADTQQLAKQFKEAAATYHQIGEEKLLPERAEAILQRQITALHLAGDLAGSDQLIARFVQTYPKSPLLKAVLFRHAENAYFALLAAEKVPGRAGELPRLQDEVIKRYSDLLAKFPDFEFATIARFGLGMTYYRKGEIEKAQATLEKIAQPDRTGELAAASYLLADCLLRQLPVKADDALAVGKINEQLEAAAKLLDDFIGHQPNGPQSPDALLKLGFCHQRLAASLAQPPEKQKALASARAAYEKLAQQFPKSPEWPVSVFERAKVMAQAGDPNGAMNELRRFTNDAALKASPAAPLALLELATLLRAQNRPADAVAVLDDCRKQHEANLLKDPARATWAALLQYHHGVALREAGKLPEARAVLEPLAKQATHRLEGAEAALRYAQCLKDEGTKIVEEARKILATPNLKPADQVAARQKLDVGLTSVRAAATYLDGHVTQLKEKQPIWEVRARMLYDAAWANRIVGEVERNDALQRMRQEQLKKLQDEAAKKTPPGAVAPVIAAPEVPLAKVPLQPSEKKARELYQALIAGFSDLPLGLDARFELAELLAERTEYEAARKLLNEALDKEPQEELADKIRLRLGECLAAAGDPKEALALFEGVAGKVKSPLSGQGHYQAGECLMKTKNYAKAAAHFAVFRDQQPYQNQPGLSDRALMRLGHALALQNQWDPSRQALETLTQRFPGSPLIHEARYGMGWAYQNAGQYDNAVNAYAQVTAGVATELAAKAQLQAGLCRLTQKRYPEAAAALLVVPFTYDFPELNAIALTEAARSYSELKQNDQAARLLRRVIKDHPTSKWANVAKQRLEALPGS